MDAEIEWSEEDGCMGGLRGLSFNIETNIVTKWNGTEESLSESNIDDVRWCLDNNIQETKDMIDSVVFKLSQTETIRTKVEDGIISISNPLSEGGKIAFERKLKELQLKLEWLKSITLNI